MRCPFCKEDSDRVIDSRSSEGGRIIRRRRQCSACKRRFTTYERIEETVKLTIIKKDGSRVPYDRQKIIAGVQKACYKRPVAMAQILALTEDVEEQLFREGKQEIATQRIGALTVERLRRLDRVAYIRYASVYRDFQDVNEFIAEANEVLGESIEPQGQKQLFDV
ncbi:MAG: transcriptional repressor NrdR [Sedimentisphaerales bacterium]|nr:transcriptional repressor NrdR [Sedimentisphaerales bacterium]